MCFGIAGILCCFSVKAQWARVYANAPKGTNFLELTTANVNSNTWVDAAIPSNYKSRYNSASLIYERTFSGLRKNSLGLGVIVPAARLLSFNNATNQVVTNIEGMGDMGFLLDQNLWGAPALTKEEFEKTPARTYSGLHFIFTIPTGKYDASSPTNIGSNRTSLEATYQYTQVWDKGHQQLDIYANSYFYGDNTQYLETETLSQNPVFEIQAYYSINFSAVSWFELGATYSAGGKTYVNKVQTSNSQSNFVLAAGLSTHAWPGSLITFNYNSTVYHPVNTPYSGVFILQLIQVFY